MSETINTSSNYDPESKKQVEINLPKLRAQAIKYLVSGGGRKGIVRNVKNSIARISRKEIANKACESFMKEVVSEMKGKVVFNINQSRLFLFKLWRELEASDESYGLLNKLPWYRRPTEERLLIDEFRSGVNKVKPEVLCAKKRGLLSSQSPRDSPPKKRGAEEALLIAKERGAEEALLIAKERGAEEALLIAKERGAEEDSKGSEHSVSRCKLNEQLSNLMTKYYLFIFFCENWLV
jgi:hypothetical protein